MFRLARVGPRLGARWAPHFGPSLNRRAFSQVRIGRKRPWGRWVLLGTVVAAYGTWKYYTHHNYPEQVANKLREGLMAEINGAGFRKPDHKKALRAYIEALHEADNLDMSPLSNEYTGIQLKIADMYEQLGMDREAVLMYGELATTYLVALVSNKIPEEARPDIIKRDLKVAMMEGLYLSADTRRAELTLLPHLQLATREAVRQDPRIARVLSAPLTSLVLDLEGLKDGSLPSSTFEPAWQNYKDELFSLREMKVGMHVASADYGAALLTKFKSTELMLQSGFGVGECLLSVANLAAVMYLQWALLVPEKTKLQQMGELAPSSQQTPAPKTPSDLSKEFLKPNLKPSELLRDSDSLLQLSESTYQQIIDTVQGLRGSDRRSAFVPEAYAIALYGLGVINAARGEWADASDYMSEARLRSRGCEVETLLQSADSEISKIDKLKAGGGQESAEAQLPDISVVYWRQAPENWVKGQPVPPSLRG